MKGQTPLVFYVCCFVFFVSYARSDAVTNCTEPNTAYTTCSNFCLEMCPQGDIPPKLACKAPCKTGCFCKPDYYRPDGVNCVPVKDCPVKCSENASFRCDCSDECNSGNAVVCDKCYWACFCNDGYSRINEQCGPNSKFGNGCPGQDSCNVNPDTAFNCFVNKRQCYCLEGFKRINGTCQAAELCPKNTNCQPNSEYKCDCPGSDDCMAKDITINCFICTDNCYCVKGFSKIEGVCQPSENCVTSS